MSNLIINPFKISPSLTPPIIGLEWQIICLANKYDMPTIARIEMATTPGGANILTGGTPTGGWFEAYKAYDTDDTTFTQITGNPDITTLLGITTASAIAPVELRITKRIGFGDQCPRVFVVRVKIDGVWVLVGWFFADWTNSGSETKTFAISPTGSLDFTRAKARAWRILVDETPAGNAGYLAVGELALANSAGGANIIPTGGAIARNTSQQYVTHLFSGTTDRYLSYYYGSGPAGWWVGGAHPTDFIPNPYEMRITAYNDSGWSPKTGKLQWTANGWDWNDNTSFSGLTWSNGTTRTVLVT